MYKGNSMLRLRLNIGRYSTCDFFCIYGYGFSVPNAREDICIYCIESPNYRCEEIFS